MSEVIWQVIAAFAGGVILNLTPCVLPIIPLKVRALLRSRADGHGRHAAMAVSLVAGSLAVFATLGLLTAYLNLQWGFLFQSQVFLITLVVFLLAAGTLMILRRPLPLPRGLYDLGGDRTDPFLTGALSTPCTGPFLGSVLAFSVTQPPSTILALFIAIGAGLATPYALLIMLPGLLNHFPRAGAGTARIEELLGFVLLGGGVFFLQSLSSPALAQAATFVFLVLLFGWVFWHLLLSGEPWRARTIPALVLILAGGVMYGSSSNPSTAGSRLAWQSYSFDLLEQARTHERPVLIEFTADWCINCKVLEKVVYADSRVVNSGQRLELLPLRVDMTRPSTTDQTLLSHYGGAGLPFAVVIDHNGRDIERFPDLFNVEDIIQAMHKAGSTPGR